MINIEAKTAGEAWVKYLATTLKNGVELPDDKEQILESEPIFISIESIEVNDPILKKYADPKIIEQYTFKMFSQDIIEELSSTYGHRLFNYDGVNQVQWAIDRLKNKWWTKSASIGLLKPNEDMPRIPCLISVMPVIRNDKVILNAVFRSQNVFNSYGNFCGLHEVHKLIAEGVGCELGALRIVAWSPHIYKSNIKKAEEIVRINISENYEL